MFAHWVIHSGSPESSKPWLFTLAMKSSPCRGSIDVFDFKEEDELPELAAGKFFGEFKNPDIDNDAIVKEDLLECGNVDFISFFNFATASVLPNGAFDFFFFLEWIRVQFRYRFDFEYLIEKLMHH